MWWKNQPKKIKDIDKRNSVFTWLLNIDAILPPWDTPQKARRCDNSYYYHSSLKTLSYPIQLDIFEEEDYDSVAEYIWNVYELKWRAYWEALNRKYDILATDHKTTITDEDRKQIIQNILNSKEFESVVKEIARNESIKKSEVTDDTVNISNTEKSESNVNDNSNRESYKEDVSNTDTDRTEDLSNFTDENIYGFNSTDGSNANDTFITERRENHDNITAKTNSDLNEALHNTTDSNMLSETDINQSSFNNKQNDENRTETENSDNNIDRNKEESNESDNTMFRDVVNKVHGRENTSPQSLIEEELELRKKIFLDIVFGDIDKLITIQVY